MNPNKIIWDFKQWECGRHWDCGEDWEENNNAQRIHKDKAAASKMRGFHTV